MDGAKAFNLLGGAALILVLGYFASTRLGGPGGPEIDGLPDCTFKQTVLTSCTPVLVDFYADWCGPCKAMSPVLDQFASRNPGVTVMRVNVDENRDIAQYYRIRSIPTLMVFKNGKLTARKTGWMDGKALTGLIGK
jgi:thioredoxin 1